MLDFGELKGHEGVRERLNALFAGGPPHALLFCGPSGVGKGLLARLMAKALLCHNQADAPCGACDACRKFEAASHQDFLHLQPRPNTIPVDDVRATLEKVGFAPVESRRRAVLVQEADLMKPESMNALLKVLEEPPPGTFFLLTTSNVQGLLPTLLSRVTRLDLGFLSLEDALAAAGFVGEPPPGAALLYEAVGRRVGWLKAALADEGLPALMQEVQGVVAQWPGVTSLAQGMALFERAKGLHQRWGAFIAATAAVGEEEEDSAEDAPAAEDEKSAKTPARQRQEATQSFLALWERAALATGAPPVLADLAAAARDDHRQPLREEITLLHLCLAPLDPAAATQLVASHRLFEEG